VQARTLPARRGWAWIVDGFAIWKRNPALITFLVMAYSFIQLVMFIVPYIGPIVISLTTPALALGIYNGCKAVADGRKVGPEVLFSGFRQQLPELVKIGGINFLCTLALVGISMLIDPGMGDRLVDILQGKATAGETLDAHPGFGLAVLVTLLGFTPLAMAYWFAPLLAAWGKVPAVKALFFSYVACLRNWRAFLVYGLSLMLVTQAASLVVIVLDLALPVLGSLAALAFPLVFMPVVFASLYANTTDVFGKIAPDEQD
jgi:hypothetical protein